MDRSAVALAFCFLLSGLPVNAGVLAEKAEAAKARNETFVEGSGGWRFLPADLRFADKLSSPDLGTEVQPAIEAIADFSEQLKRVGISLIVMPVPPKAVLQGAALGIDATGEQQMCGGWQKIMEDLASRGVQVVDLLPAYTAAKERMFCLRDTHWSGAGMEVAVGQLLPVIRSTGIEIDTDAGDTVPWKDTTIKGDLGGDQETVKLRFRGGNVSGSESTQVLLVGDSHVLVFHAGGELHTVGAGLPEQLAAALGGMPEVVGVRGSGATSSRLQLARNIRAKSGYLEGKKLVIWVFAGREFTEADAWKKFPVLPAKSPR